MSLKPVLLVLVLLVRKIKSIYVRVCVSIIVILGFPSVGKSTLMSKLTGTHSEVGAYEFTTLTTVPGIIQYKGAKLQVSKSCQNGSMTPRLTLNII